MFTLQLEPELSVLLSFSVFYDERIKRVPFKMSKAPEIPTFPAFNLTDLDRKLLAMTDEEFVHHDWEELKSIIGESY
jgi:hypothetical protein